MIDKAKGSVLAKKLEMMLAAWAGTSQKRGTPFSGTWRARENKEDCGTC